MEFTKDDDETLFQNETKDEESDEESEYSYENEDEPERDEEDEPEDDDDEEDEDDDEDENLELFESNMTLENKHMDEKVLEDLDGNQNNNISDDDESDSEDDEYYLQKFSKHINTNNLENLHPGINICNNEEISALSRTVRDQKGHIIDPMHTTLPFLTKYEKARLIGARAEQLDRGAIPMIKVDPEIINGRIIAELELQQKKIPFILARPLPNGKVEYWRIQDLEYV